MGLWFQIRYTKAAGGVAPGEWTPVEGHCQFVGNQCKDSPQI